MKFYCYPLNPDARAFGFNVYKDMVEFSGYYFNIIVAWGNENAYCIKEFVEVFGYKQLIKVEN